MNEKEFEKFKEELKNKTFEFMEEIHHLIEKDHVTALTLLIGSISSVAFHTCKTSNLLGHCFWSLQHEMGVIFKEFLDKYDYQDL